MRVCGLRQSSELLQVVETMRTGDVNVNERDQYVDVLTQWADETADRYIGRCYVFVEMLRRFCNSDSMTSWHIVI